MKLLLLIFVLLGGVEQEIVIFFRGDVNNDNVIALSDSAYLSNYLFQGGPAPSCLESADFDDSGDVDISDVVLILEYLFDGGPGPAAPTEFECP